MLRSQTTLLSVLKACTPPPKHTHYPGADPGFQVRGAHLKKIAERMEARKFLGISCEKSRFYAKKSYFSNFRGGGGGARNLWGISCEKARFYAKKIIFFPILAPAIRSSLEAPPPPPPPPHPPNISDLLKKLPQYIHIHVHPYSFPLTLRTSLML